MKLRPCIDIHNGKVKQIVGESLQDSGDTARENFAADHDAVFFADYFEGCGLSGGHIILLNAKDSPFFEATKGQALSVLKAYPGKWQLGGGVNADNAAEYIRLGASHVIVTSFVFHDGMTDMERLKAVADQVGKEHLVLDLSCKRRGDSYYLTTDRWQTLTDIPVDLTLMERLAPYCDEFLIHGADAEGKRAGVEKQLVRMLGDWEGIPVTYAGGIGSMKDLREFYRLGKGKPDYTIGSALRIFGGTLEIRELTASFVEPDAAHSKA